MKRAFLILSIVAVALAVTFGASAIATPPSASPSPVPKAAAEPVAEPTPEQLEEVRAQEILAELQSTHDYLQDVSVTLGPTPQDFQAISYYRDGEIVIDPAHVASLEDILAHEIWHIIDWRDNGKLDWGEQLPPKNSADYLL
jgi:hypothetical protein